MSNFGPSCESECPILYFVPALRELKNQCPDIQVNRTYADQSAAKSVLIWWYDVAQFFVKQESGKYVISAEMLSFKLDLMLNLESGRNIWHQRKELGHENIKVFEEHLLLEMYSWSWWWKLDWQWFFSDHARQDLISICWKLEIWADDSVVVNMAVRQCSFHSHDFGIQSCYMYIDSHLFSEIISPRELIHDCINFLLKKNANRLSNILKTRFLMMALPFLFSFQISESGFFFKTIISCSAVIYIKMELYVFWIDLSYTYLTRITQYICVVTSPET